MPRYWLRCYRWYPLLPRSLIGRNELLLTWMLTRLDNDVATYMDDDVAAYVNDDMDVRFINGLI
jgi:hypothetical protein